VVQIATLRELPIPPKLNLLLLDPGEIGANGHALLRDSRARHLIEVLRIQPGSTVRIGVLDGDVGEAEVVGCDGDRVELQCKLGRCAPPPGQDTLFLAIARPVVIRRSLEQAAALGFGHIVLFRSRTVDKSHLATSTLEPERYQQHLRAGLELGCRTYMPRVSIFRRFRPLVEDHLDELVARDHRYVAHPGAPAAMMDVEVSGPLALVIGPERGLIEYEIDQLSQRGFRAVHAGASPLKVETAIPYVYGQLVLRRGQTLRDRPS